MKVGLRRRKTAKLKRRRETTAKKAEMLWLSSVEPPALKEWASSDSSPMVEDAPPLPASVRGSPLRISDPFVSPLTPAPTSLKRKGSGFLHADMDMEIKLEGSSGDSGEKKTKERDNERPQDEKNDSNNSKRIKIEDDGHGVLNPRLEAPAPSESPISQLLVRENRTNNTGSPAVGSRSGTSTEDIEARQHEADVFVQSLKNVRRNSAHIL